MSKTNSSSGGGRKLDRIKSSVLSRGLTLARLGAGAGARLAGRGLAQLWESAEVGDERWRLFFSKQAEAFSKEFGELKGSLMKAGQLLSVYGEHFFPPEANEFLKSLQHDSPPVRWEAVLDVLKKELESEKLSRLDIDTEAVASASLGQVHRARVIETGELLALKIQYPGVEAAIDSDLRALRTFLSFAKVLPKDFNTDPLFEEVRAMLMQETDYGLEADWTESYASRIGHDERYVVARVNREFSTRRVLATSFEEGVRADDPLVRSLSPERRNRLAAAFLDLYFTELFQWRLVQTDPHAGNYRVRLRPDGKDRFVLLDFGATREYPADFVESYRRLVRASLLEDRAALRTAALELRFLRENDDPRLVRSFEELCALIVEPFKPAIYDWSQTDLAQRTSRKALEILRAFPLRTPPREIVFLDRKTGGVFTMMKLLGARIPARDILLRHLDGAESLA